MFDKSSTKRKRLAAVAGAIVIIAFGASGCTRTSDGSVEFGRPRPQATYVPPVVEVPPASRRFEPVNPPNIRRDRRQVTGLRVGVRPPFEQQKGKPVTCANEKGENGRVKVVCK